MKNELGLKIVKCLSLDKKLLHFSREQKLRDELNTLFGSADNGKQSYCEHLSKKIGYMLLGVLGIGILLLASFFVPKDGEHLNGYSIMRNGYEENEKSVILTVKSEGFEDEIEVQVEPIHYSKEQLDSMANEATLHILNSIFGELTQNSDGQYEIYSNLEFPETIMGYPFALSWESSDYTALSNSGEVMKGALKSGSSVTITVKLSCYDYIWEEEYRVLVFPVVNEWSQVFSEQVQESIETLDEETAEEKELTLPDEIDGHKIIYEEKVDNTIGLLIGLGIFVLILIWISMDNQILKQIEMRNNQLLADYAGLVSKFSLYLGAGLSFRNALSRIVDGSDKNRYFARELKVILRELENGIAESKAVEEIGERCKLSCYIKLSVLLNQNLKKGNNSLQIQLKEEADKAFEERKNYARKCGEEAGTKLLFPMLSMLLVVIVMIMYPAFASFTV